MKYFSLFILFFLLTQLSCDKIIYNPDNPFSGLSKTIVLMHRGSGNNPDYKENTLQAAEYGLSVLDGIELDIQMSADGTLWLDHDNKVFDCNGNEVGCFQKLHDDEIVAAAECEGELRYHTLESVFQLMALDYPDSYISLDVKTQYCEIFSIPSEMRQMAGSIMELVGKYNMHHKVLVESSSLAFLKELDDQKSIGQCVISFGDVDKGLADARITKARGISLKYGEEEINHEVVDLVHRKGYALILWTINEPEDISIAWTSAPDFIQTDRADFKDFIPEPK